MMRSILVAIVLCTTPTIAAQTGAPQTPPRDTRVAAPIPAPTGTGVIGGSVVSADGSRPLRNANVVIIGAVTGVIRVTSTDADGRFAADNLPADRYLVGASKLPFLGAVAGAKRPARPGMPIALANGEKKLDVEIRLPTGAAISGTITDEGGQPGTNTTVSVQQWRQQGAQRALVSPPAVTPAQTDDNGRFRLFGLPPGDYVVTASRFSGPPGRSLSDAEVDAAIRGGPVAPVASAAPTERYAPIFYPGTPRASEATTITLEAGEDRQNVDMRLQLVRIAHIVGTVNTSDGQPATMTRVMLINAQGLAIMSLAMSDNRFGLNATPGSYTVLAQTGAGQASQFASAKIEVEGEDVLGVQLTLRPPLEFSGQLAFDGASPAPAIGNRRIPLRGLTPIGLAGDPVVSPTNPTGVFQVTRVFPGKYVIGGPLFFGATADSVTWSLDSVVLDGRDVTDLAVDVSADQPPKNVVVTYSDRWQQVSGKLRQPSGAAATDYTIVIFPADNAYWLPQSRRILTSRPGTDGSYRFGGPGPVSLPAGSYLLAAVTDIGRDEQYDPAFLAALKSGAIRGTARPGCRRRRRCRLPRAPAP